jgi:hypothetical protein
VCHRRKRWTCLDQVGILRRYRSHWISRRRTRRESTSLSGEATEAQPFETALMTNQVLSTRLSSCAQYRAGGTAAGHANMPLWYPDVNDVAVCVICGALIPSDCFEPTRRPKRDRVSDRPPPQRKGGRVCPVPSRDHLSPQESWTTTWSSFGSVRALGRLGI